MRLLLFVWLIIFIKSFHASSDSDDSGEGFFGDDFEARVFDMAPDFSQDGSARCPCIPRGPVCDILAVCEQAAGQDPLACFDAMLDEDLAVGWCGPVIQDPGLLDFLFTPVFGALGPVFGPFGLCVSSPFGIAGIIRGFIEFIIDFIDALDDCFDDRRRLQTDGTTTTNPFHGSVFVLEEFVKLLEYNGNDRKELYDLVMEKGGIANLAAMMKMKASDITAPSDTTPADTTRRLLDDDSGEGEFGICDFAFMAFFGGNRRRLQAQEIDPVTAPFEALLATLFENTDCENNSDAPPVLCLVKDIMNRGSRRRLDSGESDDSGDGDDGFDGCCGEIPTSIQLTFGDQAERCLDERNEAFGCLDTYADEGGCDGLGQ